MYSTHNKGKSVAAEKFVRTIKTIFISIKKYQKNACVEKLDDIFNKHNNTYHSKTKKC